MMKNNKKLVINITPKKGLSSRLEANQNLGPSIEKKDSFESLERRSDVVQRVYNRAKEIDKATDGVMREVDVGRGLSGALKRLREQRTFKEENKLVAVMDNHEDDRFRDGFKEIRIDRVDEFGRILTQKEAYKALSHGFHGKRPGKKKQEKQRKKQEQKNKSKQMDSSDRVVESTRQVHANLKTPYIVL